MLNARQSADPIFFVFDGANANQRRRKIFEGYKAKRPPASEDV
jgi:5'-3' exonuclease